MWPKLRARDWEIGGWGLGFVFGGGVLVVLILGLLVLMSLLVVWSLSWCFLLLAQPR